MEYYIVFVILGITSLTLFLKERVRSHSVKAMLLKTMTSIMFLTAAVTVSYSLPVYIMNRGFTGFVIGGLFFGLLGDIWLDLKYVYPEDSTVYTYAGFLVFGVGHILYIIGMIYHYVDFYELFPVIVTLIIGLLIGIINGLLGRFMKLEYGEFKPVVMLYGAILFMMTLLSGYLSWKTEMQNWTLNLMFIGGVLFLVSDLILSGTYFGEGKDRPIDIVMNHIFYYAAQFMIAASLIFVK